MRTILVTGGAGFIGANFVHHLLRRYDDVHVVVLDKLTYAGNLENLADFADDPRLLFVEGDIAHTLTVDALVARERPWAIVNFAAESHVDRSLLDPGAFIQTNVYGTFTLLEAARRHGVDRFHQIGTDEVYGQLLEGSWSEEAPLDPRNPYSAAKAAADLLVLAYHRSHGLNVVITRSGNNFGPYQYPEKLVPLIITNALEDEPLPIYDDGLQVRDRLYVVDHCEALDLVLHHGDPGHVYNIGAGNECTNLEVVERILALLDKPRSLIRHVADRPGHDKRYSLDWTKVAALGWRPRTAFPDALARTVRWYVEHDGWWRRIKSGEFQEYYRRQYGDRLASSLPHN
ncbi:MAG TPA: dTDP-glucose 4,6-dehydratase [Dehalococcoidia bacterium]|nr:dTDP-glucose 4,6-dehydratase [Dehalococcoidia bacterium]